VDTFSEYRCPDIPASNRESPRLFVRNPPTHCRNPFVAASAGRAKKWSRGCAVRIGGDYAEPPGYSVTVADTVGAGDAFAAAFLHGISTQSRRYAVISVGLSRRAARGRLAEEGESNSRVPFLARNLSGPIPEGVVIEPQC
jgi:sugar/nucleoside kinase (ribokinase family)